MRPFNHPNPSWPRPRRVVTLLRDFPLIKGRMYTIGRPPKAYLDIVLALASVMIQSMEDRGAAKLGAVLRTHDLVVIQLPGWADAKLVHLRPKTVDGLQQLLGVDEPEAVSIAASWEVET